MKRLIIIYLFVMLLGCASSLINHTNASPPVGVSFQVFYDGLSPYGVWIHHGSYGYVWAPRAGVDFIPYSSGGHWEYTDEYGWTWVSDYDWGWAPFHYGRWFYDDAYGWMWAPGYDWGPAWVVWGSYGGYYGWAPIGPGITFAIGYRPPARYWCFVPEGRICERNVYNYRVQNTTIINNRITIINSSKTYNRQTFYAGPRVADVEKAAGRPVTHVSVAEGGRPGASTVAGNRLTMYRPQIDRAASAKAAPAKIEKRENLKPVVAAHTTATPTRTMPAQKAAPAAQHTQLQHISAQHNNNSSASRAVHQPAHVQPNRTAPAQQPTHMQPNRAAPKQQSTHVQPNRTAPAQQPSHIQPNRTAPMQQHTPQPVNHQPMQRQMPAQPPHEMNRPGPEPGGHREGPR